MLSNSLKIKLLLKIFNIVPYKFQNYFYLGFVKDKEPLLYTALPKSASKTFLNDLKQLMGKEAFFVDDSRSYIPTPENISLDISKCMVAKTLKRIPHEHISASQDDAIIFARFYKKIIILVRDPRQATFSFYHHMKANKLHRGWDLHEHYGYPYGELVLERVIELYLPKFVKWIETWCAYKKKGDRNIELFFIDFSEYMKDREYTLKRVCAFLNINYFSISQKNVHFRAGDPEQWRKNIDKKLEIKMTNEIPDYMWEIFPWKK